MRVVEPTKSLEPPPPPPPPAPPPDPEGLSIGGEKGSQRDHLTDSSCDVFTKSLSQTIPIARTVSMERLFGSGSCIRISASIDTRDGLITEVYTGRGFPDYGRVLRQFDPVGFTSIS